MVKKLAELVFIPPPLSGHLIPIIEFAKNLLAHDGRFLITVLVMKQPGADAASKSLGPTDTRIRFIQLPSVNPPPPAEYLKSPEKFMTDFTDAHKPHVKDALVEHVLSSNSAPHTVLVLDMFCTSMVDVGNELGLPSYVLFTSGAAFLGLVLYLPTRVKEFEESITDPVEVSTYINPVPVRVLPSFVFNKHGGYPTFVNFGRRLKEMKGIFVNTYEELESHAVNALLNDRDHVPPVYTVGPVIDLAGEIHQPEGYGARREEIMKWLDVQPPSSVVFLCFGSLGFFREAQVKEIASGLERTGQRFVWSLRKPPQQENVGAPSDYTCVDEILPREFLDKTKDRGIVCGWAPQKDILAHRSTGGFVSHCGWNSILESVWFGVPIATWPMYAEQQINAFQMMNLGLAVEIRLDYRRGTDELVSADEIARAVGCVMDGNSEVRKRVKQASEKARAALMDGGSSFAAYQRLIEDVLRSKP